jgi:hypothetical protein
MHCEGHLRAQMLQNVHCPISLISAPRTFSNGVRATPGYRRVALGENKFLSTFGAILNTAGFLHLARMLRGPASPMLQGIAG